MKTSFISPSVDVMMREGIHECHEWFATREAGGFMQPIHPSRETTRGGLLLRRGVLGGRLAAADLLFSALLLAG